MTTPTLPPERLDELERLCDAATPGPWAANLQSVVAENMVHGVNRDKVRPGPVCGCKGEGRYAEAVAADMEFIAATDPSTVRALVAGCRERGRLRTNLLASERENARWRGCEQIDGDYACGHEADNARLAGERDGLAKANALLLAGMGSAEKQELRRLAGEVERLTVADRQWQTTYGDLEHVVHSIKEILGGPASEGCVWSAQRVVADRDRLRAALAERDEKLAALTKPKRGMFDDPLAHE